MRHGHLFLIYEILGNGIPCISPLKKRERNPSQYLCFPEKVGWFRYWRLTQKKNFLNTG